MDYKLLPLAYVLLYYFIVLGVRSYLLYKNTGINALQKVGKKDDAVGFLERAISFGAMNLMLVALVYYLSDEFYQYFLPIPYLISETSQMIGIFLGFGGLAFVFIAQLQMSDSWRIGIPKGEKTKLITTGFYRFSRNPIYLGLFISLIGFLLMAPNAVTFCILALSFLGVSTKIRMEEAWLEEVHPEAFNDYRRRVRRWF